MADCLTDLLPNVHQGEMTQLGGNRSFIITFVDSVDKETLKRKRTHLKN